MSNNSLTILAITIISGFTALNFVLVLVKIGQINKINKDITRVNTVCQTRINSLSVRISRINKVCQTRINSLSVRISKLSLKINKISDFRNVLNVDLNKEESKILESLESGLKNVENKYPYSLSPERWLLFLIQSEIEKDK
jgi:hypothetical protein